MRRMTVSRMRERYAQTVLTFWITYIDKLCLEMRSCLTPPDSCIISVRDYLHHFITSVVVFTLQFVTVVNMLLTSSTKVSSFCENHSISLDSQTKSNALRSQSNLQNQNMPIPMLKESNTNLVIPGPCQKETLSTSKHISPVMCLNMPFNIA